MILARRGRRQRIVSLAVGLACALAISSRSEAVNLPPGGAVSLGGVPGEPGVVIHDEVVDFQIRSASDALLYQGRLQNRVVRLNASGTLAFIYRIRDTQGGLNGILSELVTTGFSGFLADVDFSTTSLGTVGPARARRSPDGVVVTFDFASTPVFSGAESRFIEITTDATEFVPGGTTSLVLSTGESATVPTVVPARGGLNCGQIDFEDRPLGAEFPVGSAFVTNGVVVRVRQFFLAPGACADPFFDGMARIGDSRLACREGNEIGVNNVNLDFDFGGPVAGLVVHYGEFGGNINVQINGDCISVNHFADLPPQLGGVLITDTTTSGAPGNGCGRLELEGPIHSIRIGGQELWLDDLVCIPDPCRGDETPPVAELTAPPSESCVCNPVVIEGTADDPDGTFDRFVLEYRRTTDPTWTTIKTSTTPVSGGVLATWDTTGLPQGRYLIRLTVLNACNFSTTAVTVVWLGTGFDNLTVRTPQDGSVYGGNVCFDGTVWDNYCFDQYVVEYQPAGGGPWQPVDPATPVYTGTVINDPFATWDTLAAGVPDGEYQVRVRARDLCGNTAEETRVITVDNTPPTAVITAPTSCTYVSGIVSIRGTAADANLNGWVVQYTGGDASGWVTIASGNTEVLDGVLAEWDTTGLRPCAYTLRLVVTDRAVVNCNSAIRHRSEYTISVNVGICGDCDADGDVDLSDLITLQGNFTGPRP